MAMYERNAAGSPHFLEPPTRERAGNHASGSSGDAADPRLSDEGKFVGMLADRTLADARRRL